MSRIMRHFKKTLCLALTVLGGLALSTLPPKDLTAQQVNMNVTTPSASSSRLDVKAKFIQAAHVTIQHGTVTAVNAVEPASGETVSNQRQDIYLSFVGGSKGDAVVVNCEIERDGTMTKTCADADISGPSRQMVQAGDTLYSNLTAGPDVAQKLHEKDMTVVISFSYI
jgi:hypothetical protein